MYAYLTALLSREKKGVYGPRKLVMEMSNILVLDKNPELVKNVLLRSLLFKQCQTKEQRLCAIEELILDYIRSDNEVEAMKIFHLMWPCILEMTLLEDSDPTRYFKIKQGKEAFQLYSVDLSKTGAASLDDALIRYARRLDYLILSTFTRLKHGARVPEEFIELASKELARATHIMSNPNDSSDHFNAFIVRLGYQAQTCDLVKKIPRILRESLQNLPEREEQFVSNNLLEYMVVIKEHLQREDERARYGVIEEVSKVVSIALCHYLHPQEVRAMFLEAAPKLKK